MATEKRKITGGRLDLAGGELIVELANGGGGTEPPPPPPEPPPPPTPPPNQDEVCRWIDSFVPERLRNGDEAWSGWCVGGGMFTDNGLRAMGDRDVAYRFANASNHVQWEWEVFIPRAWTEEDHGGLHFCALGMAPAGDLPSRLRLDFSLHTNSFHGNMYYKIDNGQGGANAAFRRAGVLADAWNSVVVEASHDPQSGDAWGTLGLNGTTEEWSVDIPIGIEATLGRFVKWGRMHYNHDPAKSAHVLIRNERLRDLGA